MLNTCTAYDEALVKLCRGGESNTRRLPLQGSALPLSYRGILLISEGFEKNLVTDYNISYKKLCCKKTRAYSIAVERFHGMEQVGVRLPVGPQTVSLFKE